ncbi:MAG TPA: hypothetical protein VIG47_10165, partial [Gemmatimonadaceae bacterium]
MTASIVLLRLATIATAVLAVASPATSAAQLPTVSNSAPRCDTVVSRTTAAALSGMRIHSVTVKSAAPAILPGAAGRAVSHLHRTTRVATILRDFPIAAGDTVDTLVVGESMRRLRQRPYLANAELAGVSCGSNGEVDVTIVTTDKWSLNPSFAAQANSSYGGVEERNLFGTGRAGSLSLATREGRVGGALGYTDPFLLNLPLYLRMRLAEYGDGDEVRARIRNADQSVSDVWRYSFAIARYRRDTQKAEAFGGASVLVAQAFHREGAFLIVGHRIGEVGSSANSILFGFDFERASLNAPDNSLTVGPKLVERRYHGPTIGLARRAAVFDTVSWLAERQLLVDVPLGVEMEGLLSGGREDVSRSAAAFGSLWVGRMWVPREESLASLDFWSSGYRIGHRSNYDAASSRALMSYYTRRGGALYTVHFAAEKLVNPDPDVRALETYDPTLSLIPSVYRLSENAAAAEFERATHLHSPIRAFNVDAAIFTAASYRTASALSQHDHFGVAAVGAGLRLIPGSQGSGSLRLDVLYP